ncbi:hypothetical protein D8B31_24125 [Verminephrobacter eiseniae]|nr:hypothetical protein [Verminephrobacter eiseniae]MCW8187577.1 hypothetical protein [Verminephrobacter eiseniae]MCW8226276.1 hypothetical protein [Verminephrobacter eiseniae]
MVITGVGAVSSAGFGRAEMFDNIHAGGTFSSKVSVGGTGLNEDQKLKFADWLSRSPQLIETLSKLPSNSSGGIELRVHSIDDEQLKKQLRNSNDRKASKIGKIALLAVDMALSDGGRKIRRDGQDIALIFGMSKGPHPTVARFVSSLHPDPKHIRTLDFPGSLMNAVATYCSISKGIRGYNTTLATGFNSGLGALTYGYELIRQGVQPQAIVGGADESFIGTSTLLADPNNQVNYDLAEDAFKTYGRDHGGLHVGEGACMVLLEDEEVARQRGAKVLGRLLVSRHRSSVGLRWPSNRIAALHRLPIRPVLAARCALRCAPMAARSLRHLIRDATLGYGVSNDVSYFRGEDEDASPKMMERAIRQALVEAAVSPDQVNLLCGSSWGTKSSSMKELEAIRRVFGERASSIPLINHNGYFGFVESAAALLNLAMVLTSAERGQILPLGHTKDFCQAGFDFVTDKRPHKFSKALLMGATEGGGNYAVVLGTE